MAGAEEPTAEETAPVTGEDGEVVATGEESTVSNLVILIINVTCNAITVVSPTSFRYLL